MAYLGRYGSQSSEVVMRMPASRRRKLYEHVRAIIRRENGDD